MLLAGRRILVVEDEFLIAAVIADAIDEAGGQVVGPFPTMVEALENLDALGMIDSAILDVGLGSDASYPLADALQTTRIPFIFLTGLRRTDLPSRFATTPHMEKPFIPEALMEALAEFERPRA